MTFAAAATSLPSLWTGLLRVWVQDNPVRLVDAGESLTKAEAITHLKALIRQYEQTQPSYADDLRSALAQIERQADTH